MEPLPAFLSPRLVMELHRQFATPFFIYDQQTLERAAKDVLSFPNAFSLTARYAMKACPTARVLQILENLGLHFDASSSFEAHRAVKAGILPEKIQLTSQELPKDLEELVNMGVHYNACSLHQLECYGKLFPSTELCIRVNPGLGSGEYSRTNVGGPLSSFGIWHEYIEQVLEIAAKYSLRITRLHSHIGSGTDPKVWQHCAQLTLAVAEKLPEVTSVSLGGGFKVGRMTDEPSTDLKQVGAAVMTQFQSFARNTGRQLHLEIEPGAYLVAKSGALICTVIDRVDTGAQGYTFIKVDSGMNEILRPTLYGAHHPITTVPLNDSNIESAVEIENCIVVGHCCESGDLLTPERGNSECPELRCLQKAHIGDIVVIGGCGAYCSSMAAKHYNSFPEAAEMMIGTDGKFYVMRQRGSLEQIIQNEVATYLVTSS